MIGIGTKLNKAKQEKHKIKRVETENRWRCINETKEEKNKYDFGMLEKWLCGAEYVRTTAS